MYNPQQSLEARVMANHFLILHVPHLPLERFVIGYKKGVEIVFVSSYYHNSADSLQFVTNRQMTVEDNFNNTFQKYAAPASRSRLVGTHRKINEKCQMRANYIKKNQSNLLNNIFLRNPLTTLTNKNNSHIKLDYRITAQPLNKYTPSK